MRALFYSDGVEETIPGKHSGQNSCQVKKVKLSSNTYFENSKIILRPHPLEKEIFEFRKTEQFRGLKSRSE